MSFKTANNKKNNNNSLSFFQGAVREDKVLHPKSRKVAKLNSKELRKLKIANKPTVGGQRLQILGEKLLWFHDNLQILFEDDDEQCKTAINSKELIELIEAYIERNNSELEQINLKNSVGGQFKKRNHNRSRIEAIELSKKTESEEFNGCGFEVPDLLDLENLKIFREWNGELRYVQNIKLKRYTKKCLQDLSGSTQTTSTNNQSPDDEKME